MAKPTLEVMPPGGVYSDFEIACEIGATYGYEAMPWQRDLLEKILMEDADGRYVADRIGFSAPRRQGKTVAILILILYQMLVCESNVAYTAHLSKSSRDLWKPLRQIFEETDLADEVKKISGERGHETIELVSGATFQLFTRQEGSGSGRGSKADVLLLDESYDLPQGTLADLTPMVRNSDNPLIVFLGSPSYEQSANGQAFRNLRENTLNGTAPRNAWIEYGAGPGADIKDREVWFATNPAVEGGFLTERQLESDILSGDLSDQQIKVEYLGSWYALNRPVIVDIGKFEQMGSREYMPDIDSELTVAVDSDPDGRMSAVIVAGYTSDNVPIVEVIQHGPGIAWVSSTIRKLHEAQPNIKAFVIDRQSILRQYAEDLQDDGIPIIVSDTEFMSLAAPAFVLAYSTGQLRHRNSPLLRESIISAANRSLMGRNAWKPAETGGDITVLVAAALALYALKSDKAFKKIKKKLNTDTFSIGGKVYHRR